MDAPTARRVSFADHARRAADGATPDDPETSGRAAVEATRLAPLQAIQVAFDQLHTAHAARLRGEPWPHTTPFADHAAGVMTHARRHAQTLAVAADAARSMIEDMSGQIQQTEDHMADEHPRLTPDGSPHPLEAGGYDPAADPQLPSNVSDVAALKEGKATRRQAEAIARADADAAAKEGADPGSRGPARAPILTPSRQQAGPQPQPPPQQQPQQQPPPPPPPTTRPDRR